MAVKAPPSAPAPVPTWTGWYAGVNFGVSFGHVKTDTAPVTVVRGVGPAPFTTPGVSDISYPSGFIGGAQIGYNWQYSPLIVVGLEADFQGALERESNTLASSFGGTASGGNVPPPGFPVSGSTAGAYQTIIDWFGTVRGRIGYVWGDGGVMTYVTGGLAYGEVKVNGTSTASGIVGGTSFSVTHAIGLSHVNTGWVVGLGTEGKLLIPGWTYKIESLYMDLGTLDATDGIVGVAFSGPGFTPPTVGQSHAHFTDGTLRAGLNYQFH
jgi:outer membrane immunogenic protein